MNCLEADTQFCKLYMNIESQLIETFGRFRRAKTVSETVQNLNLKYANSMLAFKGNLSIVVKIDSNFASAVTDIMFFFQVPLSAFYEDLSTQL